MTDKGNESLKTYLQNQYPEFDPKKASSRLSSLYSDFSSLKETNSYGYEANIAFWRSAILKAVQDGMISCSGYKLAVSEEGLVKALDYGKHGRPLGLHNVLKEMIDSGDLVPVESVIDAGTMSSSPWSSYLLSIFVARPLKYAASLVGAHRSSGLLAVMPALKQVASKITEEHQSNQNTSVTDNLMTVETFRKRYSNSLIPQRQLTDADIWLILRYLESSKAVAISELNRGHGVQIMLKFANAATIAQKKTIEITETDKGILSIMETSDSLKSQIEDLESTMSQLTIATKECLNKKQKPQALYKLKQKKRIETVLEKRLQYLDAMDTILFKIENSQNDAQMVQAYDMGANALKNVLSSADLDVDNIDLTMDKVQDAFADQKEIDDALQLSMNEVHEAQYEGVSNEDLELELAELEQLEAKEHVPAKQQQQHHHHNIPVPSHKPIIHQEKPVEEEPVNSQKTKIPLELQ